MSQFTHKKMCSRRSWSLENWDLQAAPTCPVPALGALYCKFRLQAWKQCSRKFSAKSRQLTCEGLVQILINQCLSIKNHHFTIIPAAEIAVGDKHQNRLVHIGRLGRCPPISLSPLLSTVPWKDHWAGWQQGESSIWPWYHMMFQPEFVMKIHATMPTMLGLHLTTCGSLIDGFCIMILCWNVLYIYIYTRSFELFWTLEVL